jgi:PAS domain S-box-containing protein
LSAFLGGTGAGLLATVLSAATVDFLFLSPTGSFWIERPVDLAGQGIFVVVNLMISFAGDALHVARRRTQLQVRELHESQDRFRILFETLPLSTFLVDPDTQRIIDCNDHAAQSLGYSREELRQLRIVDFEAQLAAEEISRSISQVTRGEPFSLETRHRTRSGEIRNVLVMARALHLQGRTLNYATAIDITERKQAEAAQARLASIVEWSEDAILSRDLDGRIQTWNAGAERMFGYRADEAIGQPVNILLPPELIEDERQMWERLERGEAIEHYETVRVTKDGRRLNVSLTISPLKDSQGRVVGASKIVRDIGELVRARHVLAQSKEELERLVDERTAKLREAMAELEHMSYSMIHDMRAPLRAIQSFATLAEEECSGCHHPQSSEFLRRIRDSSSRLDRLITDALNYSKVVRQDLPVTPVDIAKLLHSMLDTYPDLQPAVADITLDFNHLVVLGNESLLTQCFGNLLGNAVKFVPPGMRPRIRVWAEPSTANHHPSAIIHIQDNGIGIPKQAHEKIFKMFQRMHRESEYPGTGIGLAIVRKAAERMGGQVGLQSEPGKGTTFWIQLFAPAQPPAAAKLQTAA